VDRSGGKTSPNISKAAKHLAPTQSELTTLHRHLITQSWIQYWEDQKTINSKLVLLKSTPTAWSTANRSSRRQEILLARLRIDHTRATHSHLFKPDLFEPPNCIHCAYETFTVGHIFTCPCLAILRHTHNIPDSHPQALHNSSPNLSNLVPLI